MTVGKSWTKARRVSSGGCTDPASTEQDRFPGTTEQIGFQGQQNR